MYVVCKREFLLLLLLTDERRELLEIFVVLRSNLPFEALRAEPNSVIASSNADGRLLATPALPWMFLGLRASLIIEFCLFILVCWRKS